MSVLRQNMATKEWVIISEERAKRPDQFHETGKPLTTDRPVREESCPFCPGNEGQSEAILVYPSEYNWQARVVYNKFPAITPHGERTRIAEGVYRKINGVGTHEVLIECPEHNSCHATSNADQVRRTLLLFQRRGRALAEDDRLQDIVFFQNHGRRGGASLEHPHSQIISLPIIPHHTRLFLEEARRHFDDLGACVYCEMIRQEHEDGERIILETEYFVAFVPYAAPAPFDTWIFPKRHCSSFLEATEEEVQDLGRVLFEILHRLYYGLNDPDYNYVIRTAPLRDSAHQYYHWHLQVLPRVTRTAGFEKATGMYINPSVPEESARFLREPGVSLGDG